MMTTMTLIVVFLMLWFLKKRGLNDTSMVLGRTL